MRSIFKPSYHLMNRLNFRGKFIIICSVFAIPLAFFAVQLANSYHLKAQQVHAAKQSLAYIQKTSTLIQELEALRDLNVIISWRAYPAFAERYATTKTKVLDELSHLISATSDQNDLTFLKNLNSIIETEAITKGTESASIDAIYDDAQTRLEKVYNWRSKLSYNLITYSQNNRHFFSIINLLNDTKKYSQTLGEARSFGSLYLAQQFIDSNGVKVIENTYQDLSGLVNLVDLKNAEYRSFLNNFPYTNLNNIKQGLLSARDSLYQQLILAPAPTSNPIKYFESVSKDLNKVYQYNQILLDLASDIIEKDYSNSLQQRWLFYLTALCISLLILYLAIGVYYSISTSIRKLLRAASFFAQGKYDKPIEISTNDELSTVAKAMDSMRINIKEREAKLALISQTDGLTQLSNRKYFDQALQISLANSRRNLTPMTIVMMDIDFFKKVNDQYGHLAGDDCLIQIAKTMKDQFKRQTDVVARYGGEEFIAILYGQTLEQAQIHTEDLRAKIEASTIVSGEHAFNVTASFGIASLMPPEEASAQDLIALADALLYQSKDNGRNCIHARLYHSENG